MLLFFGNKWWNINIKQKILNVFTSHPKKAIFEIGPEITFVIETDIGSTSPEQAIASGDSCAKCMQ